MAKKKVKKAIGAKQGGLIGARVAALAAGAGLAYYLSTHPKVVKQAKKTAKHAADTANKWAGLMYKDLVKEMKKAKRLSKPQFDAMVNVVAKKYAKLHKVSNVEMTRLVKEMKAHWAVLEKEVINKIK